MNRAKTLVAAVIVLAVAPALVLAQPVITSISPSLGPANTGAVVYIYGTGFGSLSDVVYFPDWAGDHVVNPEALVSGGVRVRVPPTWSGLVYIQANGAGSWSNGVNHDITYNYSGTKWFSWPFTWYLNSTGAPGNTFNETRDALVAGYNTWSCASGITMTYGGSTSTAVTGQDGENVRRWQSSGWSPGTIAVCNWWYWTATGEIFEADITFNSQHYTWDTSGAAGVMDIQNIGTHEEGHSIGLLDLYGSADDEETMYGYSGNGDTIKRSLHTYDAYGAEFMYPHTRANFTGGTPSGWWGPIVPRNTSDGTGSYAPLPSTLNGNTTCYVNVGMTNNGGDCASPGGLNHIHLDGSEVWWLSWGGVWGSGYTAGWPNSGFTIRGGRHTLQHTMDDNHETLESSEVDNTYTAQFVWSPYLLSNHVPVTRGAPPERGSLTYVNCDGLEFSTGGNWWAAVGIMPANSADDYDLRIHNDTPSSTNGFDTYEASSSAGTNQSDFVLVNGNNGGGSTITRWAGINRYSGGAGNVYVQLGQNVGTVSAPVTTPVQTLHGYDVLNVHEIYLGTATSWDFTLDNISGGKNLGFALYAKSGTHFGKYDYVAYANSYGGGLDESFTYVAPETGYYGLVVFKVNSGDMGTTCTYDLDIQLTPPNLTPTTATGWDYPVVLRNDNTASGGNVHVSTYLDGATANTYFNLLGINDGPNPADHNNTRFYLDTAYVYWLNWGAINAGQYYEAINWGPLTVRGGRHMVEWRNDWDETVVELDETDNDYIRQYVWTPLALADQTPLVRSAPPPNGFAEGFTYPNCDGFQFTWGGYWGAVGILPTNTTADYDTRLHNEAVTAQNGFDTYDAWSTSGSGGCDFVLVNGNNAGGSTGTRQVGVLNYDGETASYVVQQSNRVTMVTIPDTTATYTLNASDILDVFEIYMNSPAHYTFKLINNSTTTNLNFALYDRAGIYYDRFDYIAQGASYGDGADESFSLELTDTGFYGLVVYKAGGSDYGKSASYEVQVSLTPSNLRPNASTGWDYPVIARNDNTAVNGNAHVSATLDGNTYNTYFSQCGINDGYNPAPLNNTRYYLDGDYVWWVSYGAIGTGASYFACNSGPLTVRGGRHTILWRNDWDDQVVELDEGDNDYAIQFVWSPLVIADETPVVRTAPPDRGTGTYPNSDGFRYAGASGYAWVTATCPVGASDDYDLYVYTDYSGAQSGFSTYFGGSGYLAGQVDHVGARYTMSGTYYPAAIRWSGGSSNCVVDAADAYPGHVSSAMPSLWLDETLGANRLVDIYEVYLNAGTVYDADLFDITGGGNLVLIAYPPSAGALVPGEQEFFWNFSGAGGDEGGDFTPGETGWYNFVIHKWGSADVSMDLTYDFRVRLSVTGVEDGGDLPAAFALRPNTPNPFNPMTTLRYEVPAPGANVRLEVFDLTGRRVRTLVNEPRPAGFHETVWDGRDDGGREMPSGIYFYRLTAGKYQMTEKMTLVK